MNKKKETPLSLRETQIAVLDVLKRVDKICRSQGFQYSVADGTLIGAVRHGGFIPWDDDIDIHMPRSDYDNLLSYFAEHSDELYPLMVLKTTSERNLPYLITRISDYRYRMVGEYGDEIPEMGAFIDVCPIDGAGRSQKEAMARIRGAKHNAQCYLRSANFSCNDKKSGRLKRVIKRLNSYRLGDPSKWARKVEENARALSLSESSYVADLVWAVSAAPVFYPARCYSEFIELPFEDMIVYAPKAFDEVLTIGYGDYMSLPPESERVPPHEFEIVRRDAFDVVGERE